MYNYRNYITFKYYGAVLVVVLALVVAMVVAVVVAVVVEAVGLTSLIWNPMSLKPLKLVFRKMVSILSISPIC